MTTFGFWIIIVTLSVEGGPEKEYRGEETYPTLKLCMAALGYTGDQAAAKLDGKMGIVTARCVEEPSA